jgi:hypothetical protein
VTEVFRPEDFGKPIENKSPRGFFLGVTYQYKFLSIALSPHRRERVGVRGGGRDGISPEFACTFVI